MTSDFLFFLALRWVTVLQAGLAGAGPSGGGPSSGGGGASGGPLGMAGGLQSGSNSPPGPYLAFMHMR